VEAEASQERSRLIVDEFLCENAQLIINTLVPGKLPLEFDIK
jgi:hypothetical protein